MRKNWGVVVHVALQLVPTPSHLGEELRDVLAELRQVRVPPELGEPLLHHAPEPYDWVLAAACRAEGSSTD